MSKRTAGGTSRPSKISERSRASTQRQRNKVVAIAVDGRKTENDYFKGWKRKLGNCGIVIKPMYVNSGGNPYKAVTELSSKISHDRDFDELWCVCDIDGASHENVEKARALAKRIGAELILSDRCFEIWIALHWERISLNKICCEKDAVDLVCKHYTEYSSVNKTVTFSTLYDRTSTAIANATWLEKQNCQNPSTNVHNLVERIMKLSEK